MPERATYAVLLTPRGRGAVATVLVAGPRAVERVSALVCRDHAPAVLVEPPGRICLGRWGHGDGEEVVVTALDSARVEIHCHGGMAAPRAICDALVAAGCDSIDWRAWSHIDTGDPLRRSALAALAQARTERAAMILLDQYQGSLARTLVDAVRLIAAADWPAARAAVAGVLARWPIGSHLVEPWRVVLAGPPNVGKSSLVNALVGYQRAIVYDAPGTTRDMVTATTALDGWPVELCDTAGLRQSREAIEVEGVRLARQAATAADLLVLVFSAQEPWQADRQELLAEWPGAIVVYSKCDLGTPPGDGRPPGIATSAVTRAGLDALEQAIVGRLVPHEPAAGAAIPLDADQVALLERLLAAIDEEATEAALATLAPWLAGEASIAG
jgi:tRNA modification GTPase